MMFLIETPDKRILHMGDFRTHGFMGEKLKKLLLHYVLGLGLRSKPVDILITEGTNMTREEGELLTEDELLTQACALMREHKLVFCICSSTILSAFAIFIVLHGMRIKLCWQAGICWNRCRVIINISWICMPI